MKCILDVLQIGVGEDDRKNLDCKKEEIEKTKQ